MTKRILATALISFSAMASVPVWEEIRPGGASMPVGGDPSLTIWTGDSTSLDMYYLGSDGNLWTSWCNGDSWLTRDNLGASNAQADSRPVSASANGWEFTLWDTAVPNAPHFPVKSAFYDPSSGFSRGQDISPMATSRDLTLASWDGYGLDAFYQTSEGLTHKVLEYGSMQWTGEDCLGQIPFTLSSAVFVPQHGKTYVFGKDPVTTELYYFEYWGQTGSVTPHGLTMICVGSFHPTFVWANSKLHLFWRDENATLCHQDLATGLFEALGENTGPGGPIMGSPVAVSRGDNRIDLVFRTSGGPYYHVVYIDDVVY